MSDRYGVVDADFWRSAPDTLAAGGKEWSHFSLLAPDFDLIVNFNVARRGLAATPRLAWLLRDARGDWAGDVHAFRPDEVAIAEGATDVVMGAHSARFADGRYRLVVDLPARGVAVDLELTPIAYPVVAHDLPLSGADRFHWAVVPRLLASGTVTAGGRSYAVRDAPAYHDRNWGRFAWGGDSAWEWATVLPEDPREPWSLVISRLTDRAAGRVLTQSMMLWRGDRLVRKFYGRDLQVERHGALQLARPLRIPRVAALALPGMAADAPRGLDFVAAAQGESLRLSLSFEDFAQIVFPNDRFPGLTALSECPGRAEVTGRIGGVDIAFTARAQAEFNHAA